MPRRAPRGRCGACGRVFSLRWWFTDTDCGWALRRHNTAETKGLGIRGDICEGSGCDPKELV